VGHEAGDRFPGGETAGVQGGVQAVATAGGQEGGQELRLLQRLAARKRSLPPDSSKKSRSRRASTSRSATVTFRPAMLQGLGRAGRPHNGRTVASRAVYDHPSSPRVSAPIGQARRHGPWSWTQRERE